MGFNKVLTSSKMGNANVVAKYLNPTHARVEHVMDIAVEYEFI